MGKKKKSAIERRQEQNKEALVEQLGRTPVVHLSCRKAGVSRATYYRWLNEDADFLREVKKARKEGRDHVSDMAESQILILIQERNLNAIKFWLIHHHPAYGKRVEVDELVEINFSEELEKRAAKFDLHYADGRPVIDAESEEFKKSVAKFAPRYADGRLVDDPDA